MLILLLNKFLSLLPSDYIGSKDNLYMVRYYLLKSKYGWVRVHKILRSDQSILLHDHPWNFLSIILYGKFSEIFYKGSNHIITSDRYIFKRHSYLSYYYRNGEDFHRLRIIPKQPVYTLVFTGPKLFQWGFSNPKTGLWVYYKVAQYLFKRKVQ